MRVGRPRRVKVSTTSAKGRATREASRLTRSGLRAAARAASPTPIASQSGLSRWTRARQSMVSREVVTGAEACDDMRVPRGRRCCVGSESEPGAASPGGRRLPGRRSGVTRCPLVSRGLAMRARRRLVLIQARHDLIARRRVVPAARASAPAAPATTAVAARRLALRVRAVGELRLASRTRRVVVRQAGSAGRGVGVVAPARARAGNVRAARVRNVIELRVAARLQARCACGVRKVRRFAEARGGGARMAAARASDGHRCRDRAHDE